MHNHKNKHRLVWNEELHRVGVPVLDDQHREIIERVNLITDAVHHGCKDEEVHDLMDDLILCAYEHFAFEERLMGEYGYPDMESHVAEHFDLIEQVRNMRKLLRIPHPEKIPLVLAFLADWAESHILQSDKEIGTFLADRGANG